MLNSITIYAIRKTSSLPNHLKLLLLSLAVSDLGVGLIVQLITLLVIRLHPNGEYSPSFKNTYDVLVNLTTLPSFGSFFGVTAVTVDRFLAIHLHLRYQELVTHKRVVAVSGDLNMHPQLRIPHAGIIIFLIIFRLVL